MTLRHVHARKQRRQTCSLHLQRNILNTQKRESQTSTQWLLQRSLSWLRCCFASLAILHLLLRPTLDGTWNAVRTRPIMHKSTLLVLALLLAAAVAGRAQDGAAATQQAAQPQQGDEAQAADDVTPDASSSTGTAAQQPGDAAEQAAGGQMSGGSDAASQQPAQQDGGEQSSDAQPAQQKDAFTAEQLEVLQQQIQQAIETQQNREEVRVWCVSFVQQRSQRQGLIGDTTSGHKQYMTLQVTSRVYAQLVAEAPAAELASGDADVSTTGAQTVAQLITWPEFGSEARLTAWHVKLNCTTSSLASFLVLAAGACAAAFDVFCASIKPGEGRFAECLTEQLHQEQLGNVQGEHYLRAQRCKCALVWEWVRLSLGKTPDG